MKKNIFSFLTVIFYLSLVVSYGIGVVHSFKKHGVADGLIGAVIFPWAIYRGVEFWWHDDYKDVDWDKRLTNDMQTCVYFIALANDNSVDKYLINENLEKFYDKINKYPDEQKYFLRDGTKKYIEYSNSLLNDFILALNQYKELGHFNFQISEKSLSLENELLKFKLNEDIELSKSLIEEMNNQVRENLEQDIDLIDVDLINKLKKTMELSIRLQRKEHNRIFKTLFNEEL